jgi:hypothetical protein
MLTELQNQLRNGDLKRLEAIIKTKSEKDLVKLLDDLNKGPMKDNDYVKSLSERVYGREAKEQKGIFRKTIDAVTWAPRKIMGGIKSVLGNKWLRWGLIGTAVAGVAAWYFRDYLAGLYHEVASRAPQGAIEDAILRDRPLGTPPAEVRPAPPPSISDSDALGIG